MNETTKHLKEIHRAHEVCTLELLDNIIALNKLSGQAPVVVKDGAKRYAVKGAYVEEGEVVLVVDTSGSKDAVSSRERALPSVSAYRPDIRPDGRYSINETCTLLGIHRHTLRAWTLEGKIKCIYRRANGRPAYKGVDILACWSGVY